MLKVNKVSKIFKGSFGAVNALEEIDFSVNAGEITAVQGPSGSGKTTLLLTLGAMMSPSKGTVEIDGKNPYEIGYNERTKLRQDYIGFVFQQFNLIPYLTVFENIIVPACSEYTKKQIYDRAEYLLDRFEISNRAAHKPAELSAGQQQRTALARALINEPKIILADEPTGNLDSQNAKVVIEHLCSIAEAGAAVIIVTHDNAIDRFNIKSVELKDGQITNFKNTFTHNAS